MPRRRAAAKVFSAALAAFPFGVCLHKAKRDPFLAERSVPVVFAHFLSILLASAKGRGQGLRYFLSFNPQLRLVFGPCCMAVPAGVNGHQAVRTRNYIRVVAAAGRLHLVLSLNIRSNRPKNIIAFPQLATSASMRTTSYTINSSTSVINNLASFLNFVNH